MVYSFAWFKMNFNGNVTNSATASDEALHRDLFFTLGTPRFSSIEKRQWRQELFHETSARNEKEFYAIFSTRVRVIRSLLNGIDGSSPSALKWIYSFILPRKIAACLTDFFKYASSESLNLEAAQQVYALAQDLKRHESNRQLLWQALPKAHRTFLHHLCPWTEDLTVLSDPIDYQYLEDGGIERANRHGETITNFGHGQLFKVQPPVSGQDKAHYEFPLADYSNFKLAKASPYRLQAARFSLLTPKTATLDATLIGRMGEIFDVHALQQEIEKGGEESIRYMNQLLDLFSCYRSGLCSALDLPVYLPTAIGRQGEWSIWPKAKKQPLNGQALSPSIMADLHRLIHFEKLWKINVLADASGMLNPQWTVCDGHLFVDGILPLPTFINQDVEERHRYLLKSLLDSSSQAQWNQLEEAAKGEYQYMAHHLQGLNILLEKGTFHLQDLIHLHPQALLTVRLLRFLNQDSWSKYPIAFSLLVNTATQMLSPLLPEATSTAYTYNQALKQKGERLTETLLQLKDQLKRLVLLETMEKLEKQPSTEEFISHVLQQVQATCEKVADELNQHVSSQWPLKETPGEHFMLCLGQELLDEIEQILQKPRHEQELLYDPLILLRKAADDPRADSKAVNQTLQSILHDAMIRKYSHAFLATMRQQVSSIDHV
jgi:hypothetical protein